MRAPVRSLSSCVMQELLQWRNPGTNSHGIKTQNRFAQYAREAYREQVFCLKKPYGGPKHFLKVGATELFLCVPFIVALVETVAYSALSCLSLILYPYTSRPIHFFVERLESSAFTVLWVVAAAVYYNLFKGDLPVVETDARNSISRNLTRQKDMDYLRFMHERFQRLGELCRELAQAYDQNDMEYASMLQNMDPPLLAKLEAGAQFLINDVLGDVDQAVKTAFIDLDPEVIEFVCAKMFFIYAKGAKSGDPIPSFLTEASSLVIEGLRANPQVRDLSLAECQQAFRNLRAFEESGELVKHFKNAAEYQNSFLLTRCWQRAKRQLQKAVAPAVARS